MCSAEHLSKVKSLMFCLMWPRQWGSLECKNTFIDPKNTNKRVNKGETEYGLITIFIFQKEYFVFKRDKFWHQIRGELSKQEKLSLLGQLYLYLYMCLLILIAGAVICTVSPSSLWLGTFVISKGLSWMVIWPACGSGFVANLTKSATAYSREHYGDVIMSAMASQITGVPIVCLNVCSGTDQRKQTSQPRGIDWWPVDSPVDSPHNSQRASNAEDVSIWWHQHEKICGWPHPRTDTVGKR